MPGRVILRSAVIAVVAMLLALTAPSFDCGASGTVCTATPAQAIPTGMIKPN